LPAPVFNPLYRSCPSDHLHVLVDFSVLHPEGENGGLKHFLMETVQWLGAQEHCPVRLTYLVAPKFHSQLKTFQRPGDRIISIRRSGAPLADLPGTWRTGDHLLWPPPVDLALQLKADVVYAPMISMEFACPGVPTLGFVADLLHRDFPSSCSADEIQRREEQFAELVLVANRIQCISQFGMDRLHFHYPSAAGRAFFTHVAIHDRLRAPSPKATAIALPAGPYFFYPANAWLHKNHERLLAAFSAYRKLATAPPWKLVLTGNRDERMDRVLALGRRLGLDDAIHYLGYVNSEALACVWQHAGALVFPSLYEGFGIPPTEAMHYGVPILSSREASLPEVIGDAALYFDASQPGQLAEGLDRISSSPELRADLIEKGRQRLRIFSIARESEKLLAAIRGAVAEPAKPFWRGADSRGAVDQKFLVGLPPRIGPRDIQITLDAIAEPIRVRLYQDVDPLGAYLVVPGTTLVARVPVASHARALVLEKVKPAGILLLREVALLSPDAAGSPQVLFSFPKPCFL
jgi:glycosyltransferase involved in cell wall biosynthesis